MTAFTVSSQAQLLAAVERLAPHDPFGFGDIKRRLLEQACEMDLVHEVPTDWFALAAVEDHFDAASDDDVNMTKKDKNPKGGLSQKGREKYNKATGSHLKAGVKNYSSASLPDKKRWISWASRFAGIGTVPPLTKPNGEPTRFALSFAAWGEPVPKSVADVRKVYAKAKARKKELGYGSDK